MGRAGRAMPHREEDSRGVGDNSDRGAGRAQLADEQSHRSHPSARGTLPSTSLLVFLVSTSIGGAPFLFACGLVAARSLAGVAEALAEVRESLQQGLQRGLQRPGPRRDAPFPLGSIHLRGPRPRRPHAPHYMPLGPWERAQTGRRGGAGPARPSASVTLRRTARSGTPRRTDGQPVLLRPLRPHPAR